MYALGICVYVTYVCDTVMMIKFIAGIAFGMLVLFTVIGLFDLLLIKNSDVY
jgi:hypothetical protein